MDHREIQVLEHDEVQRESGMNSSRGTLSKEWSVKLRGVIDQFRGACITLWKKKLMLKVSWSKL